MSGRDTSPTRAKTGDGPGMDAARSAPAQGVQTDNSDPSENDASTLIEAPVTAAKSSEPLKRHDFPEGGGSGGAEAFRRGARHVE